jgi:hypothetical protein
MAREEESKLINGHEWKVTPFPGMYGTKMKVRLGKTLGPAFKGVNQDIMDADIGVIISGLFEAMDEEKTPQLIKDLLHGTFIDGKDAVKIFDLHFSGNYKELHEGLAFVLSVNYGDFLELAGRFTSRLKSTPPPIPKEYREDLTQT